VRVGRLHGGRKFALDVPRQGVLASGRALVISPI
jgi:hypothetical protein